MSLLSHSPQESARKASHRIRNSLQHPGSQAALAKALGISESTVSRILGDGFENVMALIYQSGFKVVPADRTCVDPANLDFMRRTTARVMTDEDMAHRLFEEDE